jgi:hypothetical protein
LRIVKAIGAGITISVCFLYLGCGSIQIANAAHGSNTVPLTIETRLLPSAIAGTPYVAALDATGGTPSYTWAITSGQLPAGVTLSSSTGVISGTPTISGNFSVGLTLTDDSTPSDKTASTTVTISVAPPPMSMAATTTLFATYGVAYSQALTVTGGTPPYTWSVTSGKLPLGLSLASSTGIISGTPSTSGIVSFTVAAHDSESPSKTKSSVVTMDIAPAQLKLTAIASATATAGTFFTETLQATGGAPVYKWSIASGSLPAGLALNSSTGTISGVPSASGTATFTALVNDSSNPVQASSASVTIIVAAPPLTIAVTVLPSVMVGAAYSQTLQVSGGTAPYKWSITSGQLAPGLTLSSGGTISGVPTVSGSSSFTATVADSSNPTQSASTIKAVTVTPTPLKVSAPLVPVQAVGSAYSQSFSVTGGTAPYIWRVTSGSLPAGLTLTQSGIVSGIAQASGTSSFTATVSDSSSPAQSASATDAIVVAPTPLVITSSALASVTVGSAYSQGLQATGGTAPYQWTITSGTLPAGLSLTASSGMISGTATTSGTSTFTATVTDSSSPAQATSTSASITVAPAPLSIPSTTLASFTSGKAYVSTLHAVGGTAPYTWTLSSGLLPQGIALLGSGVISGTPTSSTSTAFTVTVTDGGNPAQTQSANLTLIPTAPSNIAPVTPLSIVSSALASATTGVSYTQSLQATGGTPAYLWTITSGSLPTGLTLAATTGTISGTPSAAGTSTFTASLTDNGSPAQTQSVATSITVVAPAQTSTGPGTTWFVRPDGGTRFSTNVTTGQCDGKADVAYPGSGTNQHCAFNDVRDMWMDGTYGNSAWIISGGDTLVIRGCTAPSNEQNPDNPHCRIGKDDQNGGGACQGVNAFWGCSMPPPPSGSSAQHTRILGGCAYDGNCTPVISYPYTSNNLAQLFGGFNSGAVMYLSGSSYVDVEGLEITTHNGQCTRVGYPQYPSGCSTSTPTSDYASWGIITTNTTSNILLQDIYIHGLTTEGIGGPIGGPFTLTRVSIDFNAFAGWNFDDGVPTPDAPGSSITQSYVTMIGNGCLEQYPIVNPQFPALSCWDTNNGGFGDSWSGQNTTLDSFSCDHCNISYNTKDGALGPHSITHNISLTNSIWVGNMGQNGKWGQDANATFLFQNNIMVGNCVGMSAQLPGASQSFNLSTGLNGSYLSGFCRAGGGVFDYFADAGSTVNFNNNTIVTYQPTIFTLGCTTAGACGATPYNFNDNLILGYTSAYTFSPFNPGSAPGLYYIDEASVRIVASHNLEYGTRDGDTCGTNGIICSDPLLVNEPATASSPSELAFDTLNFHPSSLSPAIGEATAISGLTTDYYGVTQTSPATIGAVGP